MKIAVVVFLFAVFFVIVGWVRFQGYGMRSTSFSLIRELPGIGQTPRPSSVPLRIEVVADNLFVPWSLVFVSDSRLLFTERNGRIRVLEQGQVRRTPLLEFPEVSTVSEEGLMGLTKDPNYLLNAYLYVCYAYTQNGQMFDKVVRLVDEGERLRVDTTLLEHIPAAAFHAGCRLAIGPDDKLYITTGDATKPNLAQDRNSLAGKILRINLDGSIPEDNPFPNSPVYSLGHRNPQGIDWHPLTGSLWSTEHGPSGSDGPGGGDEVNRIEKGGNYGWPIVSHERSRQGLIDPALVFTPAIAPASGMFYSSDRIPQLTNTFLFGLLRGEGIMVVRFDEKNPENVSSFEKLSDVTVGRVRDVVEGPDGAIYFSTSNRDGRGRVQEGDDKIYRITPQ